MADVTNVTDITDAANVTEKKFDEMTSEEQGAAKIDLAMELRQRFLQERSFGLEVGAKSLATVISNMVPFDVKELKAGDCRRLLKEIKKMCDQIRPKSETLEELEKNKQELIKLLDPEVAKKVYGTTDEAEKEAAHE